VRRIKAKWLSGWAPQPAAWRVHGLLISAAPPLFIRRVEVTAGEVYWVERKPGSVR